MFRRSLLLFLAALTCGLTSLAFAASLTAGDLSGTVKDASNRAISNVRVRYSGPSEGSTRTDATGKYLLANLPAGDYDLYFQKPGWVTVHKGFVKVQANQVSTLNVTLEWADKNTGALEIAVENRKGRAPLPGTILDVLQGGFPILRTTTDETGTTVIPGLAPGIYRVAASRPGFEGLTSGDLRIRAAVTTRATLRLQRNIAEAGRLGGIVRDLSGAAISGAKVRIVQGFGESQISTPANGRYEFTGLIPGSYALEVSATGFQTQTAGNLLVQSQQLTTRDFTLVPNAPTKGSVTGKVTDSEGGAIALARITITAGPGLGTEILTGSDGRYTLSNLTPGTYSLLAEADGFSSAGRSGLEVKAGVTSVVDFTLGFRTQPPGSLIGLVREAGSGLLLPGVVVEVVGGPSGGRATVTELDGGYLLEDLVPYSSYTLRFRKEGYVTFSQAIVPVNPAERSTLNAQLSPLVVNVGNIEGSVRAYGGGTLSGVKVTVYQGPTSPLSTTTDTQGRFSLKNLKAGTGYAVRVEKTGYATLSQTGIGVTAGQTTRLGELVMSRAAEVGSLRVVVIDLAGRGIPGAGVSIVDGPSRPPRATTDTRGLAHFDALQEGIYTVEVVANGYQNGRKTNITVTGGRSQETLVQLLR